MMDENLSHFRFHFLFFMFFKFTPLDFWSSCYSPPSPNSGSSLQSQLSPAGILVSNCLTHPRQCPLFPSSLITWRLLLFDTSTGLSLKHPLPFRTQRETLQSRFYFPCNLPILTKDFQGNAKICLWSLVLIGGSLHVTRNKYLFYQFSCPFLH